MVHLADLPPDILALICRRSEALMLWKCGSRRLMSLLSRGGVTSISLIDHHSSSTSRFPRCLSSFLKLRDLTLDRGRSRLMNPEEGAKLLKSLSQSLERLDLTFELVQDCFTDFSVSFDVFADPDENMVSGEQIWSIKRAFPSLKTLSLDNGQYTIQNCSWTESDLEELPPTLTHLKLVPSIPFSARHLYSALPKKLETLELSQTYQVEPRLFKALPESITSLPRIYTSQREMIASYPPGLTSLMFDGGHLKNEAISLFSRFNNLIQLDISGTGWDLSLGNLDAEVELSIPFLSSLPRTLTTLELPSASENKKALLRLEDLKYLPEGLVSLGISILRLSDAEKAKKSCSTPLAVLPSLKTLSIQYWVDIDVLNRIPQSITRLTTNGAGNEPRTEGHLQTLVCPPFLRTLHSMQSLVNSKTSICYPRYLEHISIWSPEIWGSKEIEKLPRFLTILNLQDATITEEACEHLPSTLSSLTVGEFAKADDKNARFGIDGFGHYLREEYYWDHEEEAPKDERSEAQDHSDGEDNHHFFLPISITHLRVKREVSLHMLPESITALHIEKTLHYTSTLVPTLPSGLKALSLPFLDASHPGEARSLPRGLTKLNTTMFGQLGESDIDDLPKTLTHLQIEGKISDIAHDLHEVLPPNLDLNKCSPGISAFRLIQARQIRREPVVTPDPRVTARFLEQ